MYSRIKYILFTAIYALLWIRFFFMIWDPYWGGVDLNLGLSIYRDWRGMLDWIYTISGYLMLPVYTVYGWLAPFIPKTSWFPGLLSVNLLNQIVSSVAQNPGLVEKLRAPVFQQSLVGYIDWLVVPAVVLYSVLNPLLDLLVEFFKNLIWNVLIEFSFTKRKESTYKDALEKRAADLMKLNTQYKNLSKEASMLAQSVITDELTKVYNKRFFLEKIAQEFRTAREKHAVLSICMVDIDHFKKLNDNYGHLLGDTVLKAVAHVAKSSTPADCYCCRFGGEEFSIIMPGKRKEEALKIVSVIHESLPRLRFQEDENLRTSASFGVCVADFSTDAAQHSLNTYEDLIKLADDQLYQAKLNGRNRVECNNLSEPFV